MQQMYYAVYDPTNCKSVINNHLSRMLPPHVSTSTRSSSGRYYKRTHTHTHTQQTVKDMRV